MQQRKRVVIGVVALAVTAALGSGIAIANNDDDGTERPITGEARVRAEAVALEYTHGGRVTETEEGDEESLYEVEVTLPDGSKVDVQLDKDFKVVGSKTDDDSSEERG